MCLVIYRGRETEICHVIEVVTFYVSNFVSYHFALF